MGTAIIDYQEMRKTGLAELRRLNEEGFGGLNIFIDVDAIERSLPKIPCDCLGCYLLQF